jgi:hypothetical protein
VASSFIARVKNCKKNIYIYMTPQCLNSFNQLWIILFNIHCANYSSCWKKILLTYRLSNAWLWACAWLETVDKLLKLIVKVQRNIVSQEFLDYSEKIVRQKIYHILNILYCYYLILLLWKYIMEVHLLTYLHVTIQYYGKHISKSIKI